MGRTIIPTIKRGKEMIKEIKNVFQFIFAIMRAIWTKLFTQKKRDYCPLCNRMTKDYIIYAPNGLHPFEIWECKKCHLRKQLNW